MNMTGGSPHYTVLARRYRPQKFDDVVAQLLDRLARRHVDRTELARAPGGLDGCDDFRAPLGAASGDHDMGAGPGQPPGLRAAEDETNSGAARPALGYIDHPPLAPLLLAAIRAVLGDSILAIRLLPALTHALLIVLTACTARRLGGGTPAQLLASTAVAWGPGYLALCDFYSMNCLEVLLWATVLHVFVVRCLDDRPRLWWALGALLGLAALNKHTVITLVVTGQMFDGSAFEAFDCVRIVGPGPENALVVNATAPEAWVDVAPADEFLDEGGFATFERFYEPGGFGFERTVSERLAWWAERRRSGSQDPKREEG